MILGSAIKVNNAVCTGGGINDLIRDKDIVCFICFDFVKLCEIRIVIALIIKIITGKLHGNGCVAVKTGYVLSLKGGTIYAVGPDNITKTGAAGGAVQVVIQEPAAYIDGIYRRASELFRSVSSEFMEYRQPPS